MSLTPLGHIALHSRPEAVLDDAVASARRITGAASAFAATMTASGEFRITARDGLYDKGWDRLNIRTERGLGGRVLAEDRPLVSVDYLADSTITGDYRDVVRAEGLRAICCVPLSGANGPTALLYLAERYVGGPEGRAVDELVRIADMASVGLTVLERSGRRVGTADRPAPMVHLTARERDILDLLATGASNRRIAERLHLAESTVKGYLRALLQKFDVNSRLQIVVTAQRWGLLEHAEQPEAADSACVSPHESITASDGR